MVLIVDNLPVPAAGGTALLDALLAGQLQQARCSHFLAAPVSISPRCKSIHVVQNEVAVISTASDQQVAYVGSTDATTCVVVALMDEASGLAAVAHFDTDSAACRHSLRACLPEGMAAPVLYLVGGYADAGGAGRRTCAALLAFFHAAPQPITLRLLCTGHLNTDPEGAPRCQSLAVCLRTGAPHPAHFADRGPMIPQRLAQLWVRGLFEPKLERVYDTPSGRIALSLLVGVPYDSARRYVAFLLQLSEGDPKEFLRRISTSPEHEGPGFMQDMQMTLRWMLEQQGPLHRVGYSFEWGSHGWEAVQAHDAVQPLALVQGSS